MSFPLTSCTSAIGEVVAICDDYNTLLLLLHWAQEGVYIREYSSVHYYYMYIKKGLSRSHTAYAQMKDPLLFLSLHKKKKIALIFNSICKTFLQLVNVSFK